jgi:hypothetical protein
MKSILNKNKYRNYNSTDWSNCTDDTTNMTSCSDSYSSDCSYDSCKSSCDYNKSDSDSNSSNSSNKCDDLCDSDSLECSRDCGMKYSHTPVGIWNLIFNYDSTMIQNRPSQLVLNEDGTFNNFASPDLNNNPFPVLLTPGVGIWKETHHGLKLEGTHIGYKQEDGNPEVYYTVHIKTKLHRKGTRMKFHGKAVPRSIDDPRMCKRSDLHSVCFTGCGVKILTPKNCLKE